MTIVALIVLIWCLIYLETHPEKEESSNMREGNYRVLSYKEKIERRKIETKIMWDRKK